MESISSMKMIALPSFFACAKRSRTRLAPTPTNISIKSEPVTERNPTPASPATARAKRVLPVPGGPTSKMPFGTRAPISLNRSGFFKKSTTSLISSLTPSYPAMSEKVVEGLSAWYALALLLPTDIMLPACPMARRCIHTKNAMTKANGRIMGNKLVKKLACGVLNE